MEQFANNAATTLDGGIDHLVTSIVVASGSMFPATGNYRLLVAAEIMICTARSGNTLTVIRGQEGTTAFAHGSGAAIELVYTKGSIETLLSDYQSIGGYASRPSTNLRKGQEYFATDLMNTRWYYDGTNWNLIYPTYITYANRIDMSGWTAFNHSTWVFTDKNGILEIRTDGTVNNNTLRGYHKAHGLTAPFSFTITLMPPTFTQQWNNFYFGFRDSVSGRLVVAVTGVQDNATGFVGVEYWNTYSSWNSSQGTSIVVSFQTIRWLKVEDDGTNINVYVSSDGKSFSRAFQFANNAWLTNNRAEILVACFKSAGSSATGTPAVYMYQYLLGLKEN